MQRLLTPIGQAIILAAVSVIIGLGLNAVRSDSIPLLAKQLEETTTLEEPAAGPILVAVNLAQAKQLYDDGVIFIDARSEEYYDEGHIAGAWKGGFLLELAYNLEEKQGKDGPIVVYCSDDGCGDSEDMAYDLQAQGFTRIYVFKGGWQEWVQAGYPTE
jgi:rhodanese-related sulfurtransferase